MKDLKLHTRTKSLVLIASLTTLLSLVLAHRSEDSKTTSGWMMDGSWMHSGADMMGYNMWGMGWFGFLFSIAIWVLVILGIIYLYQKITEK